MRKRFLLSVAVILGFVITLLGLQQKIFADSEYPHSDVQDDPLLCFIIGGFVIAIIVVSAYILLRIQHKNHMKMIGSQGSQKTVETEKVAETEKAEGTKKTVETEKVAETVGAEKTEETEESKQDE